MRKWNVQPTTSSNNTMSVKCLLFTEHPIKTVASFFSLLLELRILLPEVVNFVLVKRLMGLVFEVVGDWLMWKEQHSAVNDTEQPRALPLPGILQVAKRCFFFLAGLFTSFTHCNFVLVSALVCVLSRLCQRAFSLLPAAKWTLEIFYYSKE